MKYIPVKNRNRKSVGRHWTPRYLRGIQCILQATHGVVGTKKEFFEAAFGKNIEEFKKLLLMPDNYIIYREAHKNNGAAEWEDLYTSLTQKQKDEFLAIVEENQFSSDTCSKYPIVNALLAHYKRQKTPHYLFS